jgi:antitoxin Phd
MEKWQLYEAKNKLSNIIDNAMHGKPQCITKRGDDAVMVIGMKDYQELQNRKPAFNEFLLGGPKFEGLKIERAKGQVREM